MLFMVQASLPQNKAALEMMLCSLISLSVSRQPEQVHQILAYRGFQVSVCLFFCFVFCCNERGLFCVLMLSNLLAQGKRQWGRHEGVHI